MTNNGKEYPDFFKVFLSENHSERMLIPNAFVKLMQSKRRLLKDFILRDKRGSDWHVKARLIGDELYFDHGWKQFREENSLEENDFLVFTHIENNAFKFKIFELSSMCEKIKVTNEEAKNDNMMEDVDKDEEDDGDDDSSDEDGGGDYEDVMTEEEEDDDDADEDEDNDDECIMKKENDEDNDDECIMKEENKDVYKEFCRSEHQHCRTCKACDTGSSSARLNLEDDDIDAEIYIQPGNPHFIAKHSRYRPNELHFPKNVIKDLCVCFTKYIKLVCCDCKDIQSNDIAAYHHILPQIRTTNVERRGEIRTWKNGRVLALGWEDFCRKSKITENDRCLCEIVMCNGEAIEMIRVHVVRKVKKK